jgi:hypothetical protein
MTAERSELGEAVAWASAAFSDYKTLFEHSIGFHNDGLHVLLGVALQIAVALIFKKSLAHWFPWITVLALAVANEANDLLVERWPSAAMQLGEGLKDVVLTLAVPTLLLILAKWRPALLIGDPPRRSATYAKGHCVSAQSPPAPDHADRADTTQHG